MKVGVCRLWVNRKEPQVVTAVRWETARPLGSFVGSGLSLGWEEARAGPPVCPGVVSELQKYPKKGQPSAIFEPLTLRKSPVTSRANNACLQSTQQHRASSTYSDNA